MVSCDIKQCAANPAAKCRMNRQYRMPLLSSPTYGNAGQQQRQYNGSFLAKHMHHDGPAKMHV